MLFDLFCDIISSKDKLGLFRFRTILHKGDEHMIIIHSINKDEFEKEIKTGSYGAKCLERYGFIHCSDLDTYYLVAPNFKNDYTEKVILIIDTERLNCEVKWEDGGGFDYPHIYGLLNQDAIIGIVKHLWSDEREWIPNDELKKYAVNGFRRKWEEQ